MHLLRPPPQPGRPPEPDPRPDPAHFRDPQPLSLQQRTFDGGAARPRSRPGIASTRSARGAGRDAADRHPAGGPGLQSAGPQRRDEPGADRGDRKSTRLNSSHDQISYAVFCLKTKKKNKTSKTKYKKKQKKTNKK